MIGFAEEKVQGGKLLRVRAEYEDVIKNVQITGDFFVHPEDTVEQIERSLFGINKDVTELVIQEIVNDILAKNNAQLIGIDSEAIARVLKKAIV